MDVAKRVIVAAVGCAIIAGASVLGSPTANAASGAGSVATGWTLVTPSYCFQYQYSGLNYLYIYPTSGGYFWTTEPELISSFAEYCGYGSLFYAYSSNGSNWDYTYYNPGLN
ncbi:MAG: hypothetical protein U1E66_14780 [Rhodospirillales bacterium]